MSTGDWYEAKAWAKALTDLQITAVLEEMRERGYAVAAYNADEFESMFDGDLSEDWDGEAWMQENRDTLEEAMCETAREYFRGEAVDAFAGEE